MATARRGGRLAAAVLVLLLPISSACAPATPTTAAPAPPIVFATPATVAAPARDEAPIGVVRGLLTDVQPASIAILREVELRADDGQILRFAIEGDAGITPGHAREHMVNAEPVTITYRGTPEGRVALRIDD